ncbi:Hypothetical protein DIP0683 [Corynebacterium diphtheriae]|uniref:Uncharacterized protein n=1 Tax=Corynebacterium diphtheriae (strain ATCC 700971 / NCTC 13129 / Biotype gravis) TaxID=257309 RepID=Q6NIT3_CORDI|nr:Hypothetical protein DIP0683 [Corynebacterium diphtheriae]
MLARLCSNTFMRHADNEPTSEVFLEAPLYVVPPPYTPMVVAMLLV